MQQDRKQSWTLITPCVSEGAEISLVEDEHHYAFHVLRLTAGTTVELTDGQGWKALGLILAADKKSLRIRVEKSTKLQRQKPSIGIWLAQPKPGALEDAISIASAMGADVMRIFKGDLTAVKAPVRLEKLEKSALENLRVSKSAFRPHITSHTCLEDLVRSEEGCNTAGLSEPSKILLLFCDENSVRSQENGEATEGASRSVLPLLTLLLQKDIFQYEAIRLVIGAEAGLSTRERNILKQLPMCQAVSLGNHILRVADATAAALAVTLAYRESLTYQNS